MKVYFQFRASAGQIEFWLENSITRQSCINSIYFLFIPNSATEFDTNRYSIINVRTESFIKVFGASRAPYLLRSTSWSFEGQRRSDGQESI